MGMDAVEICLRIEELSAITLLTREASAVRTVGDFYRLICSKLSLVPLPSPPLCEQICSDEIRCNSYTAPNGRFLWFFGA